MRRFQPNDKEIQTRGYDGGERRVVRMGASERHCIQSVMLRLRFGSRHAIFTGRGEQADIPRTSQCQSDKGMAQKNRKNRMSGGWYGPPSWLHLAIRFSDGIYTAFFDDGREVVLSEEDLKRLAFLNKKYKTKPKIRVKAKST